MINNFSELAVKKEILDAVEEMGFSEPTAIQAEVIPHILLGCDCLAQAPTGTGKTCAFGIPALNSIDTELAQIQILILCPTRELVMQTEVELKKVAKNIKNAKILSIYGGQNIERQLAALRKNPQVVVGTPGRVMDHLRRKTLKLEGIKMLVLDEADEMLNMGFREDIDVILLSASKTHQTVLFSATMSKEILGISKNYQVDPVRVETKLGENAIPEIEQFYVKLKEDKKVDTFLSIMKEKDYKLVLVFCNMKKRVDELSSVLNDYGILAEALHGDLRQKDRDIIMKRYRGGDLNVLVATDVAARGIDVEGIEAVFNFDAPLDSEYYVHRIGRTARANKKGKAYTFFTDKDSFKIREFERYTKTKMQALSTPNAPRDNKMLLGALEQLGSNLSPFSDILKAELEKINADKNSSFTFLDIAAALLKNGERTVVMSELAPRNAKGSSISSSRPPVRSKNSTRYFMNIGTKDRIGEKDIKEFISTFSAVPIDAISDVHMLETFTFVEVANGNEDEMHALNGSKFAKRVVAVEPASDSRPGKSSDGFKKDFSKGFKGNFDKFAKKSSPKDGANAYSPTKSAQPYARKNNKKPK